jgi:hypothetical protein
MKKPLSSLLVFAMFLTLLTAACKDDPVTPDPIPATFQLEFAFKWGSQDLVRDQNYLAPDGRNYSIQLLKYYVSRLSLVKASSELVPVKEVALVDFDKPASKMISGSVEAGTYTGLRFSVGLDSIQNHSDQSSYAVDHPLSTTQGMYWTWATRYIFTSIEGRADTSNANVEDIFLYHCGSDSLRQDLVFTGLNIVLGEGETKKQVLTLDMQQVIFGMSDTIEVHIDPSTHTQDNPSLASRVIRNIKAAIH